jgi:hypothetical protein
LKTEDCSVDIDVTVGIFFLLLKLCTTGIHLPTACSYPLDPQSRDSYGRLVALGAFALLMSSQRREIIVPADFNSNRENEVVLSL